MMPLRSLATSARLTPGRATRTSVTFVPPPRPSVRAGAASAPRKLRSRRANAAAVDVIHKKVLDPQRQAKLEKYLETWTNDVESTGPMWNAFTGIMAVGAVTVAGLGLFAFMSYGVLWGISPGTQLY